MLSLNDESENKSNNDELPSSHSNLSYDIQRQLDIEKYRETIDYSERYDDGVYEYRHVILPKEIAKYLPKNKILSEVEWRSLGVQQSLAPEPHILLFKREKDYQLKYPNGKPIQ